MDICRLCLMAGNHSHNLYDINGVWTEAYELSTKYFDSTIVNLDLEINLAKICSKCWHKMFDFNNFQEEVAIAQAKLNQVEKVLVPEEKTEDAGQTSDGHNNLENSVDSMDAKQAVLNMEESDSNDLLVVSHKVDEDSAGVYSEENTPYNVMDYATDEFEGSNEDSRTTFYDGANMHIISLPELELIDIHSGDSDDETQIDTESNTQEDLENNANADELNNERIDDEEDLVCANTHSDEEKPCEAVADNITDNDSCTSEIEKDYDDIIQQWKLILKCTICSETFSRYSAFHDHYSGKHPNEEFYISCCQHKYVELKSFEDHIRVVHYSDFKCQVCGECFAAGRQLTDHLLVQHAGLGKRRVFECPKCPIRFSTKDRYKYHLRLHDKSQHDCVQCGKMFTTGNRRMLHERMVHGIHRICKQCNKSFRDSHDFTEHLLAHEQNLDNGSLHVCEVCGQITKSDSDLQVHMNQHSEGGTLFICSHCPKTFRHLASRKKHEKASHSNGSQPTKPP